MVEVFYGRLLFVVFGFGYVVSDVVCACGGGKYFENFGMIMRNFLWVGWGFQAKKDFFSVHKSKF